jgi:ligand-binding sensor domain-containing protein
VPARRLVPVFAWCLLALFVVRAGVLVGAAAEAKYSVKSWESDEGLPQNSVLSMVQTRDGYLWIGTFHGLVRFDGLRFTNTTPE